MNVSLSFEMICLIPIILMGELIPILIGGLKIQESLVVILVLSQGVTEEVALNSNFKNLTYKIICTRSIEI